MEDMNCGKYDLVVNGYDWGPAVNKIIVHADKSYSQKKLDPADFEVTTEILKLNWNSWPFKLENGKDKRTVTSVYPCDADGNMVDSESSLIALEMTVHPDNPYSNPFLYGSNMMNDWQKLYNVVIINKKLKLSVTELNKKICPLADQFEMGTSTTDDITLSYGSWKPKNDNPKKPLIIWLHGMGEGGKDPYIVLLGNKVVNLITDRVQNCFGDTGACVLTPQADGFWMQIEKNQDKMSRWITPESKTTVSIYTKALFNLIEEYLKANPDIDRNCIYIGGCSNGGYMTMNMIIEYPEYFAAAYPVCQAYPDKLIDDAKLNLLAKQSIWFTQSKDDKTVIPENYTVPTFKRLKDMGAADVHFSFFEHVEDQTDTFFDAKGKPYMYNGHFSWVYTLNNECIESGVSVFQWLSQHSK